ncbi:hypothetical protein AVEN_183553-1 [Araneus ventricosus]|uniref:ATP-dependent DNA helicase n=1 Tax=Araneus ventricosus TaxID=182803 RepID=A0A4Y2FGY1_ARAVE|nr:hypothetical protein AVEN_183553-1 [Araneus ventricosus]
MPNVIDAEILTGHTKGSRPFIPITLSPSDSNLPFQLQRRQFPIRLGFAITINKSQGQSQKGLFFASASIFTWNVVAFSRATSRRCVRYKETGKIKKLK